MEVSERADVDFRVLKFDDERQRVFGWAYIARDADGRTLVDKQGDWVEPEDLEEAALDFVLNSRRSDAMHDGVTKGQLIESIVFTPEKLAKLGVPEGTLPNGWWVGFHVDDADEWQRVRGGDHLAFSVGGSGIRQKMDPEA